MTRVYVRTLMAGDLEHVAQNMRQADRDEIFAARGQRDMHAVLGRAIMLSTHYWIGVADEEPCAIFGVAPLSLLSGSGSPWLLGTERVYAARGALMREGRHYLHRMLAVYPHLVNYVDARNERSIRWLARLGFAIAPAAPYGESGLPFHRFEMRA